jgi:cellulose synthase/poly-beta-1,6-N-acetylglucosamine synthase-like glycosyltransferase
MEQRQHRRTEGSPKELRPAIPPHPKRAGMNGGQARDLRLWDMRLLLDHAGLQDIALAPFAIAAHRNDTTLRRELLCSGVIDEERLYRAYAELIGVTFEEQVPAGQLLIREDIALRAMRETGYLTMALAETAGAGSLVFAAPVVLDIENARRMFANHPEMKPRMRLTTPTSLRGAIVRRLKDGLLQQAVSGLFATYPNLSARSTANAWQGATLGALAVLLPTALIVWPLDTVFALHLGASLFFLSTAWLRVAAATVARPQNPAALANLDAGETETYSVMVALYQEANVVPDLLNTLLALDWPRSRLEIKVVCEEDDSETLAALRSHPLPPWFEIVEVPVAMPRTKPKALNYALQLCTGRYIAIYDAEDRPDPRQLREACRAFARMTPDVGCLQAPLDVANARQNHLTALFAMEYRALFHGLLPWLSNRQLVVPLGGTSNHFRREALEGVMAWDAYNVTEDADLGMKLYRLGYRVEMITRPTLEDAPVRFDVWLRQRTRWFKGWMQTWLVHMRNPLQLFRELGMVSYFVSQILFAGMFLSALLHAFILFFIIGIILKLAAVSTLSLRELILLAIDGSNILAGYGGLILLAYRSTRPRERKGFWRVAAGIPIYWLAMSAAAWRAAWQLWRKPHFWEKTPHLRPWSAQEPGSSLQGD